MNRRSFLAATGLLALPTIIPIAALGREDKTAPSKRITIGIIGCGNMGTSNTEEFLRHKDCQVVAACDVDSGHLRSLVKKINTHNGDADCKAYPDFRELLARRDIDAVMIAVPDHWHELIGVEAAKNKK